MSVVISDKAYEILRHAINIARNDQTKTKKALVEKLLLVYPHNQHEIDEALDYWGQSITNIS
jgi:hypothetical protein